MSADGSEDLISRFLRPWISEVERGREKREREEGGDGDASSFRIYLTEREPELSQKVSRW